MAASGSNAWFPTLALSDLERAHSPFRRCPTSLAAPPPADMRMLPKVKWKRKWAHQWFLKTPVQPVNGVVMPADTPGLGMDLDESKIEEQRPLSWTETRWSY
jgi:hypothetical protein